MFIIVGLIIFLVAFFGCCGAWKKASGLLLIYIIIISLLIIFQLVVVIVVATSSNSVANTVKDNMLKIVKQYDEDETGKDALDALQKNFKCCGSESWKDFEGSYWWNNTKESGEYVPESCCVLKHEEDTPLDAAKCQAAA